MNPTLVAPDDDPFLWLEEIEGERALAWAESQFAATMQKFGGSAFERDPTSSRACSDHAPSKQLAGANWIKEILTSRKI